MEIRSVSRDMWGMFSRYHYLKSNVASSSKLYAGFINGEPVAIVAINKFPHPTVKDIFKVGRVVTLPHWQGYGIGFKLVEKVIDDLYQEGRIRITTSLPLVQERLFRSSKWKLTAQASEQPKLGKNARFKVSEESETRQCYTETYQYITESIDPKIKVLYTKIPKEQRKNDSWKLDFLKEGNNDGK